MTPVPQPCPSIRRRRHVCAWIVASLLATGPARARSLYDETTYRPLTADNKAFRVGDVITIHVIENASAATNADTGTRRNNNVTVNTSAGLDWKRPQAASLNAGLGMGGDFSGGGSTERAGRLLAQLTVSVREVLANGDLVVAGTQQLLIDNERQRISISGRVRAQDISETNTVLSTRIADADITYAGEGDLAKRQKPSWLRGLLDLIGF